MGGASRAFGLPRAAAKRLLRAWPAPTFAQEPSGVLKRGTVEPEGAPVAVVPALCAGFGVGVGPSYFGGVGPCMERRLTAKEIGVIQRPLV